MTTHSTTPPPNLQWSSMSDREQAVWAAVLSTQGSPSFRGVLEADRFVLSMRDLELDGVRDGPEYDAAIAHVVLTPEEFATWYRVQYRVQYRGKKGRRRLTDDDCAEAYTRYVMGRCDSY